MENSKHLYKEGNYRIWPNTHTGALQMKFGENKELYNVPKNTKLYDRLLADFYSKSENEKQDY